MINRRTFLKLAGVSAIVASGPSILKANALAVAEETTTTMTTAAAASSSSCGGGYGSSTYSYGEYSISATEDLITPSVRIGAEDNSVMLTWTESGEQADYEIWRSSTPYFTINESQATLVATVSETTYLDNSVADDGSEAYFYLIRSVDNCDQTSDTSNRTGGFSFQIRSGA